MTEQSNPHHHHDNHQPRSNHNQPVSSQQPASSTSNGPGRQGHSHEHGPGQGQRASVVTNTSSGRGMPLGASALNSGLHSGYSQTVRSSVSSQEMPGGPRYDGRPDSAQAPNMPSQEGVYNPALMRRGSANDAQGKHVDFSRQPEMQVYTISPPTSQPGSMSQMQMQPGSIMSSGSFRPPSDMAMKPAGKGGATSSCSSASGL